MSQGLLLWLLLNVGGVWASRGPLRPLCRPINATLAAENEACPVCVTFTTSICAGYCPSMVSSKGWGECPGPALLDWGWKGGLLPGQGLGNWEGKLGTWE